MLEPAIWISFGNLALTLIAIVLTNKRYTEKNAKTRALEMMHMEREMHNSIDIASHQYGETVAALREKFTQSELWNRDHFLDKATFNTVISDIKNTGERLETKIDRRFDAADHKLEKIL